MTGRCAECGCLLPDKPIRDAQHCPECGHHFGPDACGLAYDCPDQRKHLGYRDRMHRHYPNRGA